MNCERWPTAYDFNDLQSQIKDIVKSDYLDNFYTKNMDKNSLFQGDIIQLDKKFVYLNKDGKFEAGSFSDYYMILGNSCDFDRSLSEIPFTNITPLHMIETTTPKDILSGLKNFQNYKRMYIPTFSGDNEYYIDFTKIMTVSKEFLKNQDISKIKKAELTFASWVLLHSCIIRYFARDDGRND
jgi:hypothetical protein